MKTLATSLANHLLGERLNCELNKLDALTALIENTNVDGAG